MGGALGGKGGRGETPDLVFGERHVSRGRTRTFVDYYRINFDGSGLTRLTDADAEHTVKFSPDMKYYVDTWSRVDLPPVSQLRRTEDRKVLMDLEHGDDSALVAAGWKAPESFSAPGRDGKTDIWGIIVRPTNFDPAKKYPVIENIYAGPQGSFVPKSFSPVNQNMQQLAELGFIVVQIDGMGTNNRSKAFHDVAFKNLADAGFADRILWHKAVAAKYPWYDISKGVGIYGTSAGGQNSLGALLFHPEFYKVAVSNSGCHDNRMDKIWWNEQWMGWPVGPQYAASSNVDNAYRLEGQAPAGAGRDGHERRPGVDAAGGQPAHQAQQEVRSAVRAGRRARSRWSLWAASAGRFLRAQLDGGGAAGVEGRGGDELERRPAAVLTGSELSADEANLRAISGRRD